jgi:hypothetical protein
MRTLRTLLLATTLACAAVPAHADLKLPRASQNAGATQTIGTTDLAIKYCRPGVKGREIWGKLVPWDKPWRTGANEITAFTTSDDITVEGQPLPAGTYGLVTIPGAEQWTIVFSKQKDMWGSLDYDPKQDQLRVTVKPQPADAMEWMQFTFDATSADACELALRWEKLRVPVKIAVDVKGRVLAAARAEVAAAKPDDWRTPYRAASYANDNDLVLDEASTWAANALKVKENFQTLSLSARFARRAGRNSDAVTQMKKALALGKADKDVEAEQISPMEKMLAEWTAK